MMRLLCKVYPKEKSYIAGLSGNKRIEAPTEVILNKKEFDLCRKQGAITVNTIFGEKDVSTMSFSDVLTIATDKLSVNGEKVSHNPSTHVEKPVFTKPVKEVKIEEEIVKPVQVDVIEETSKEEVKDNDTIEVEDENIEINNDSLEDEKETKVEIKTNFNNKNKQNRKHKNNQENR